MTDHPSEAWKRLGEMLMRRRVELDSRYRNRRTFTSERAPKLYRIINDMELGNRPNYEPGTIAAVEAAYDLAPGSLERALAGARLEPAGAGVVPFPGRPGIPEASERPAVLRELPDDIADWVRDVDADIDAGRMPRNDSEAEIWYTAMPEDVKRLGIAWVRSEMHAAAEGSRRGGNRGGRTGLNHPPLYLAGMPR